MSYVHTDPTGAKDMIEKEEAVVVDVRTVGEFDAGHIPGSYNVPFAFGTPLRPSVRAMLLVLSPVAAVVCNVIRVVPTVWLYGHYPDTVGPVFHDLSGWAMLAVAFFLLLGFVRMLRWAEVPVMQPQAALTAT